MSRRRGPKGKGRSQEERNQGRNRGKSQKEPNQKSSQSHSRRRGSGRNGKGLGNVRSLVSQAQHIIRNGKHYGESKSVARTQGKAIGRVYSHNTDKNYRSFITRMARDIQKNHPEVKFIYQIEPKHVQEFIDRNASKWNEDWGNKLQSYIEKFVANAREVHPNCRDLQTWDIGRSAGVQTYGLNGTGKIPIAISDKDLKLLCENMSTRTVFTKAPQVMAAIGNRGDECIHMEARYIILPERPGEGNWGVVHLEETKNGQPRDVTIKTRADYELFKELKERAERNEWPTIWGGRKMRALQDQIDKALKRAGLREKYKGTCTHMFRKNYAKHDYKERLEGNYRSHKSAWQATEEQMGHHKYRPDLFDRYPGAGEG